MDDINKYLYDRGLNVTDKGEKQKLYTYPLTRELINYFSPLTKISIVLYAKEYVEDRYSIDVEIDSVQAFYSGNACIDVNFTTKCEPYIHFVY